MSQPTALAAHFDEAFSAPDGLKRLRELILTLAMQGKLVEQDPAEGTADDLLKEIEAEKKRLVAEGKIKPPKPLPAIEPEEMPYGLPEGWRWVRLGDVGLIGSSSRVHQRDWKSSGIPFYRAREIVSLSQRGYVKNELFISEELFAVLSKDGLSPEPGDLMLTGVGTIGVPYIVHPEDKFYFKDASVLIYKNFYKLYPSYLKYFAKSAYWLQTIHAESMGTTVHTLTIGRANEVCVPLPPLPEQRRIVARIEQLMTRCDELEALRAQREQKRVQVQSAILREITADTDPATFQQNWQFLAHHFGELHATPQNVAELRSAVLQLAVMGKLVPQDPTEGTARELLAEIEGEKRRLVAAGEIKAPKPLPPVSEAEQPYQVPEGWAWVRAGRITQLITSGSRDWSQYLADSGATFVTMGNLSRGNYKLRLEKIRYVNPPKNAEGARTILKKDDLIISITGDVGNLGLIPDEFGEAYINQHSCIFRVLPSLRNRYYAEYMRSPVAKEQFNAPQRGIKNSFRLTDVEEMLFPLPPLAEQRRVVAKIDQLIGLCDVLEARLTERTAKQGELLRAVMAELAPTLSAGRPATTSGVRVQAPAGADAPRGRGRPCKAAQEAAEATAQPVTERRGRGRPRKDGSRPARSIPEAASMEDAIRRLEAMKRNKDRGMNGLFEE